jgi:hypothetical protein
MKENSAKKKVLLVFIVLLVVGHLAYFLLCPAIGWKPCDDLSKDKLEYVYFSYRGDDYYLSEEEIDQFIDFVRQIRLYPMTGDIICDNREYKFCYKSVGEKEENTIQFETLFVKYNDKMYRGGEAYWKLFFEQGLRLWCGTMTNKVSYE